MKQLREAYIKDIKISMLKGVHFGASLILFYLFWLLFRYGFLNFEQSWKDRYNILVLLGYGCILFFLCRTYNAYLLAYTEIHKLVLTEFFSQLFSVAAIYLFVSVGWNKWANPAVFIVLLIAQMILNIAWTAVADRYYVRLYPPRKTILVYRNETDQKRFGSIQGKSAERLYSIEKKTRYTGSEFSEIRAELEPYEAVFVAGVDSRCRNGILKYCQENNIPGFFLPHVGDVIMQGARHIQAFDSPVLHISRKYMRPEYRTAKRLLDIVFSLAGLVLLSPLMGLIAAVIRLSDGGPAIYKQTRLTRNEKLFTIYKFRSMRIDAERDGVARLSAGETDERITPVGRFMRRFRLDEMPQLFNILKGDMSFVGPRPERPEIAEAYYKTMPDFRLRLQVKAGLTGYAQVYGRYNTSPYEKLEFDLLYINQMSLLTDLELILATLTTMFSKDSTQGVDLSPLPADAPTKYDDPSVSM